MNWKQQLFEDLKRDEGFREFAYPDPLSPLYRKYKSEPWGFRPANEILTKLRASPDTGTPWTVGYGFTRGVTYETRMSRKEADQRLWEEMTLAIKDARKLLPSFDHQPKVIKTVVANMSFNMGYRTFSEFRNTLAAFERRDYKAAALGMMNSLWYRQVGKRGRILVNRVRTLEIEPENRIG